MRRHAAVSVLVVAALLVLAAAFFVFSLRRAESSRPPDAASSDGARTTSQIRDVGIPVPAPRPVAIGRFTPDPTGLPPLDAPLSVAVPALQAAADSGNHTAICRLAAIKQSCFALQRIPPDFPAHPGASEALVDTMSTQIAQRHGRASLPEALDSFLTLHEAESLRRLATG